MATMEPKMGGATLAVTDLSCGSTEDDSESSASSAESIPPSSGRGDVASGDDGDGAAPLPIHDDAPPRPPRRSPQHSPPPSPPAPLRSLYVGALSTIEEATKLDGSLVDPAANRRSATLTLPASTHESLLPEANGKRRQRSRSSTPPKGEWQEVDLWSGGSSLFALGETDGGTGSGVTGDSNSNLIVPFGHSDENENLIVGGTGSSVTGGSEHSDENENLIVDFSDENENLIVDFPHNHSTATLSAARASSDLNG